MKKLTISLVYSLLISFLLTNICKAQWTPEIRLTYDDATSNLSYNNARCSASNGDILHIVWYDNRTGNWEIFYKRSTNGGTTWTAMDTALTNYSGDSRYPSIAVSVSVVHVVWNDRRAGNSQIYYKRSLNNGIDWESDICLTNNPGTSAHPSLSVSGSVVHVVWHDNRDGNVEIYYKRSTNGGVSWESDVRHTNNPNISYYPSIAVSGQFVHIVWYEHWSSNEEIYYKRSTDGGISWGENTQLTNDPAFSWLPSLSVSGWLIYAVWMETRNGNVEIYGKRSTDAGSTWMVDTRLTNDPSLSEIPSVFVSGSIIHLVWQERHGNEYDVLYKRSIDGGANWGENLPLTNNTFTSYFPTISISGTSVNVFWQDNRDANYEIYYKRNPTGNFVGFTNINTDIPAEFSLNQNCPNPFNPMTRIRFDVPSNQALREAKGLIIRLIIYDILGREVTTLVNQQLQPGTYEVEWDGSNYPTGVYFYKLITHRFIETKKMILLR